MLGVTAGDHVAEIRKYWWRNVQEQWIPRILSPHFSFSNMNFIFPHPFKTQFSGKGNIFHVKLGLAMRYTISQFTISEVRIRLGLRAVHVKSKNYVCFELWSAYYTKWHVVVCSYMQYGSADEEKYLQSSENLIGSVFSHFVPQFSFTPETILIWRWFMKSTS